MFRSSVFSLALQKRSIPPNKVELRQAIAVVTSSSSSSSSLSKPKHHNKNNNNKIHPHSPSKTISTTKDNALLLLANIPRDGITVQKLSEQFFFNNNKNNNSSDGCYFSSFNEFSSALDFLRENCYEILRFHRISGQGREKIMFVESTASHDDRRIGLDCVRHTLGKFTQHYITQSMIDADEAEKRRRLAMEVEMPLEIDSNNDDNNNNNDKADDESNRSTSHRRDINTEQENNTLSSSSSSSICNHNSNSTVLADEFIDALRRDLKQERDARLAEEKKNRMLRKQLMDVLRIVMKSKIVTTTSKSKKSKRKKTTRDLKN